jgi:hypothetical protein
MRRTDLTDVSRSIEHSYCIIVPVSSQKDAPLYIAVYRQHVQIWLASSLMVVGGLQAFRC